MGDQHCHIHGAPNTRNCLDCTINRKDVEIHALEAQAATYRDTMEHITTSLSMAVLERDRATKDREEQAAKDKAEIADAYAQVSELVAKLGAAWKERDEARAELAKIETVSDQYYRDRNEARTNADEMRLTLDISKRFNKDMAANLEEARARVRELEEQLISKDDDHMALADDACAQRDAALARVAELEARLGT
jgi:uncharacterized coiled-coil DUF342 family protein